MGKRVEPAVINLSLTYTTASKLITKIGSGFPKDTG